MKNLVNTRNQILATVLGLIVIGTALAPTSAPKEMEANLDAFEVIEIADELILVDEVRNDVVVYDESDNLVYEGSSTRADETQISLVRSSDFLLEVNGVKYYRAS